MEVGELVGKAGEAASELGLDLEDIFADPDKLQKYSQVTIATVFAVIAWHRADSIKYNLYKVRHWIDSKGGTKGEGMKWYDWLVLVTPAGWAIEGYAFIRGQSGDFDADIAAYRDDMEAWQKKHVQWQKDHQTWAEQLAFLRGELNVWDQWGSSTIYPSRENIELAINAHLAKEPQPPVQPKAPHYLTATIEDKAVYAAVAFTLGMHPELIGAILHGVGTILQGVGEIVPL